jgi:hypothetical protein
MLGREGFTKISKHFDQGLSSALDGTIPLSVAMTRVRTYAWRLSSSAYLQYY